MRIDPWSSQQSTDYQRLRDEFGIAAFDYGERLAALARQRGLPPPPPIVRRGIVFGERGFDRVFGAIERGDPWAVLTGLMPSGPMHLGHKLVIDQVRYYQSLGADVFIVVADVEAHVTRGLTLERAREIAMSDYLPNYFALGLKPDRTQIYFQSERAAVKDLAWKLGRRINWSTMEAIYGFSGETNMGHAMAPLVQVGDILHVQLPEYGGPRPVVVPVGVDQDPHIRLTRDLAQATRIFSINHEPGKGVVVALKDNQDKATVERLHAALARRRPELAGKPGHETKALLEAALREALHAIGASDVEKNVPYGTLTWKAASARDVYDLDLALAKFEASALEGFGFVAPASTYHRFMQGLTGGKMSSSKPETHIALNDPPALAEKKLAGAVTGGRATAEEQRRLGADCGKCMAYETYVYHLVPDDDRLAEAFEKGTGGKMLCGECKSIYGKPAIAKLVGDLADGRKAAESALKATVRSE
ncbi:MAG TPA: tryptophan--tRNA ligase [Candidatus Thermoplasmatota archaeon]|nr:tryptophan--tRNA ligase [Candidatus Thermoplasmatota archaeon]